MLIVSFNSMSVIRETEELRQTLIEIVKDVISQPGLERITTPPILSTPLYIRPQENVLLMLSGSDDGILEVEIRCTNPVSQGKVSFDIGEFK